MANTFTNIKVQDVTNSGWSAIGSVLNDSTQRTIIGMTIANTTSAVIAVDVRILNDGTPTVIVEAAPVPTGGSLVVIGGDQKLVLVEDDLVQVKSNTATSADVVMSMLDIT